MCWVAIIYLLHVITVGSGLSGLDLSGNLFYSTGSVGNRKYRVLLYSNYPGLSGPRLSVSDVSACATKGRCPICIAFFYPARLDIGRTNCDLLRGATVLCAAPFLGLSKDVANSGYTLSWRKRCGFGSETSAPDA